MYPVPAGHSSHSAVARRASPVVPQLARRRHLQQTYTTDERHIITMACRTATIAAVAVLLVVAQMASAYVVPEVVLMKVKRSADPMRSFSFSGFNPNGQMAAFTGMSEYPMFSNYGPPAQAGPYHYGQDSYGLPTQDSYGPPPSGGAEQPAATAADPNKKQPYGGGAASNQQQPQEYGQRPDESQNSNSAEQADNKKPYKGRDGPSSNAEASFNAWFPIMFGVFPNGANGNGYSGQSGNSAGRGDGNQGQGNQDQGNSHGGSGWDRSSGTTVIANSVSNGRNGVATSHAISYGNPRSSSQK